MELLLTDSAPVPSLSRAVSLWHKSSNTMIPTNQRTVTGGTLPRQIRILNSVYIEWCGLLVGEELLGLKVGRPGIHQDTERSQHVWHWVYTDHPLMWTRYRWWHSSQVSLSSPTTNVDTQFLMLDFILLDHECQLIDIDLRGSDLGPGIADTPSWSDCAQLCTDNPDCGSFTWNSLNNKCFLKRGVPRQSAYTGAISGVASCLNSSSTTQGL